MIDDYFKATTPKKRIALLDEEIERRKKDMAELHNTWDLNQAMREGHQWSTRVPGRGIVDWERSQPHARRRYKINFINLWVRNMVSLLTQQAPTIHVRPSSETPDDRQKAEAGERIWQHHKRVNVYSELASLRTNDMLWAGPGWILVGWDGGHGKPLTDSETGQPYLVDSESGELTEDVEVGTPAHEGRITWKRAHPRCIFPNLEATTLSEMTDVFVEYVLPIPLIRKLWPKTGKGIEKQEGLFDYRQWRSAPIPGVPSPRKRFLNHGLVREWRVRGDLTDNPRGHAIQWSGEKILWRGPGLFQDGSLGAVLARFCPTGEHIFGKTYIEDLVDPQVNLNKILSQVILYRERIIAGKYVVENQSMASTAELTDDIVGNIVRYNRGSRPPEVLQTGELGASVFQELDLTMRFLQDLGSQQEVMRGATQPEVRSYLQTAALLEQAQRTLGDTLTEIERADAELCRLTLMLAQDRWTIPRMITVTGEDVAAGVYEFSKANLPTYIDVEYVPGSARPKSRAAQFEELRLLLATPMLDPNFREQAPELHQRLVSTISELEYGGLRKLTEWERMNRANAQRENQLLLEQEGVEVREFEDHKVHLHEHDIFRNGAAYSNALGDARQHVDTHCEIHEIAAELKAAGVRFTMPQVLAAYEDSQDTQGAAARVQGGQPGGGMPEAPIEGGVPTGNPEAEIAAPGAAEPPPA